MPAALRSADPDDNEDAWDDRIILEVQRTAMIFVDGYRSKFGVGTSSKLLFFLNGGGSALRIICRPRPSIWMKITLGEAAV
jgi:hypothetical protein